MKITYKGDYALKAMLDLAVHYEQSPVTGHDLAQSIDAPIKFLEQVLLELKKGGFIESRRGNVGGYRLSRPPADITVGEIVRYIEGPLEPIGCLKEKYTNCADTSCCVLKKLWQRVYQATSDVVDNVNLEDLVRESVSQGRALTYSI